MTDEGLEEKFTKAASLVRGRNHVDAIGIYMTICNDQRCTDEQKVRALSNLSACYAAREQFTEALNTAKQALYLDESSGKIHGRVATAYHGLKHYEEAARHYARAHELDPTTALYKVQHQKVLELIRSGRGVASKETLDSYYYRKGIEQGKEAMLKGEYLSAVRHFTKAIELHTKCAAGENGSTGGSGGSVSGDLAVLLCNRSAAYARSCRWAESVEDGLKAIELHPTYARAFFRVGYAQHRLNHIKEAHSALRRCLELEPSHAEAKDLMAEVERLIADTLKSAEERRREEEAKISEIREKQSAQRAAEGVSYATGGRGRAHATSYVLCSYCNEGGHTREECPLLRRKRSRAS
uniref:Stress-inducible protein STI1 n=1 Tax=Trypanosoma congolense (strain IL3000) TaxID=1068625 RepID=G0UK00_TRYCI|nr:conserved hypothetical protein [Trypanosoma congolense IL3000]